MKRIDNTPVALAAAVGAAGDRPEVVIDPNAPGALIVAHNENG